MAQTEGIRVEPASASAAGLAGSAVQVAAGKFTPSGWRLVAVYTGLGRKDPDAIARSMPRPVLIPARLEALEDAILK